MAPALALLLSAGAAQAVDPEPSSIVATTEGPQTYLVRPGDTLWDISSRFFDTPWVWPKLWEQNRFLANPHRLVPGQRLRLYLGTYEAPQAPAPAAPAPVQAAEPPKGAEAEILSAVLQDVGYLSPEKPELSGCIFEAPDPLKTEFGLGDIVYVRFNGARPAVGERFRVVHASQDEVLHPVSKRSLGHKYTFPAALEITELKGEVASARITESFQDVEVSDGFVPWFPMPEQVVLKRGGWPFEGTLVAAQEPMFDIGQRNLVFLDVGTAEGVQPGLLLGVWRAPRAPEGLSVEGLQATRLGQAVVVAVRPDSSTALILSCLQELAAGDKVRPEP